MAIKLKNLASDLYRAVTGIPKSELKTQGQMIREDYKQGPGLAYTAKSAILQAYNFKRNVFRPKGGKKIHAALDISAPLVQSTTAGKIATEVVNRVSRGGLPYSDIDPITRMPLLLGYNSVERKYGLGYDPNTDNSFPVDGEGEPDPGNFVDLIPVRIGQYQFRGAVAGITDSSTPTWTGTSYAGRPDNVYTYSGVERTISFDMKVYAISHKQIKDMYQRVNKLYDLTRPTPDNESAPTRMSAPLTRLTIGNYINEQVIMTSLTVSPEPEMSWEINDPDRDYPSRTLSPIYSLLETNVPGSKKRYVVPRVLNINLSFTVLHDSIPTTANKVFKSITETSPEY